MDVCERELEVVAAAKESVLSPVLRAHVDGCAICTEALDIARDLSELAALDADEPLPAPRWLLLKAHLRRQQAAADRLDRWHAWTVGIGAFALLLIAGCLVIPQMAEATAVSLQQSAFAGGLTLALTTAGLLWRWSARDR